MKNIFVILALLGFVALLVVYRAPDEETVTIAPLNESLDTTQEKEVSQTESVKEDYKAPKKTIDGMTIEVLTEGTGTEIKNGQTAIVDYTGRLLDGTVFDSSIPRGQPFEFPLGAGMVIDGWEKGVLGMKIGETRKLTIPPELAYGERGAGAVIPPNATLIFEVTLRAIK